MANTNQSKALVLSNLKCQKALIMSFGDKIVNLDKLVKLKLLPRQKYVNQQAINRIRYFKLDFMSVINLYDHIFN